MERSKTSPYLKIICKECCKMKFLSNEKLFKCVCLFMMTLTGISILVGTQLMKIILSVALGLFVVYALLNLIFSIQEKNKK